MPLGRGADRAASMRRGRWKLTQVFWSKGYDGVTIDDLVAGMGVGRPAYMPSSATSGRYSCAFLGRTQNGGALAAKALLSPQSLRDSIADFLRYAVESATEKGSARGCLMMCVAPIVNDAEVQRFLQSAVAGGVALVERRFQDGISAGDIPPDFPVTVRAIQTTDFARALTMRARIGTPRKTLLRDAEAAADLAFQSPRGNAAPER